MKQILKKILRRMGLQISRYQGNQIGIDPFIDISYYLRTNPKPVILDVGANTGQTAISLKKLFPSGIVHSFEPSKKTFEELNQNCQKYPSIFTWNLGIGSSESDLQLHENRFNDMSSFLMPSDFCWGNIVQTSTVKVTTIDKFSHEQNLGLVDLLKSDTQGFEMEVLKGASNLLRNHQIHLVYVELIISDMYKNLTPYYEILNFLDALKYTLISFYKINHQEDQASWTDALFISNSFLKENRNRMK